MLESGTSTNVLSLIALPEVFPGATTMLEWAYSGVDFTLAGNGGQECLDFIGPTRRILETILFICVGIVEMYIAYPHLHLPKTLPEVTRSADRLTRRILLLLMCTVFGIELGFKFATRQMIWIFNPCHVVTVIQIYLLVAPPSPWLMATFRVHMHCLNGATIAMLFPVINTRLLPCETETYYVQHLLMLVIPYFLMREGGVYTPEPISDPWWCLMSMGILFIYHWVLLQGLAMLSFVNMNHMMCPAVSDPFYGQWYRIAAAVHQSLFVGIHGKFYTWVAQKFLPTNNGASSLQKAAPLSSSGDGAKSNGDVVHRNGHTKEL